MSQEIEYFQYYQVHNMVNRSSMTGLTEDAANQIVANDPNYYRTGPYTGMRPAAEAPKKEKMIIVSGYFNPIHKGHLEYFENAKDQGDKLLVIVNSDLQRELKGSKEFQDQYERCFIVGSIKTVDTVVLSIDKDRTVCETLKYVYEKYAHEYDLAFANGGDQNNKSIPEVPVCQELGIQLIDGLGDKIQSSSWLLKK